MSVLWHFTLFEQKKVRGMRTFIYLNGSDLTL